MLTVLKNKLSPVADLSEIISTYVTQILVADISGKEPKPIGIYSINPMFGLPAMRPNTANMEKVSLDIIVGWTATNHDKAVYINRDHNKINDTNYYVIHQGKAYYIDSTDISHINFRWHTQISTYQQNVVVAQKELSLLNLYLLENNIHNVSLLAISSEQSRSRVYPTGPHRSGPAIYGGYGNQYQQCYK